MRVAFLLGALLLVFSFAVHAKRAPQRITRTDPRAAASSPERTAALARIEAALAAADVEDATVVVGRGDVDPVVFVKGAGGVDVVYFADSAQKWILATLLLRDARARGVTLTQPLSTWPNAPAWAKTPPLADSTLRDFLSFTSGLEDPPACAQIPAGSFARCLNKLASSKVTTPRRYFYGTHHMMLALGALSAGDVDDNKPEALLQRFRTETGLLRTAKHDGDKPLKLTITPGDYAAFLRALSTHKLLSADDEAAMFADQVGDRAIARSPSAKRKGERWHYGLGNWVECPVEKPCSPHHHSAGARGFYPFIDVDDGDYGVIAHNAGVGDWSHAHDLYLAIRSDIDLVVR
jgi:CubicO group peptidase (beta-lactamase class C family)